MSATLKNPEERKKGMLSDQPQLSRITSTALLCHWGQQLLEDMMFLGTDFETHAIWQGYVEEPAAKDFIARKARTIALSKVQGTHLNMIKCKSHGNCPKAVIGQATINLIHEFGNPLGIPYPSCTA
jgi:hypothetical protein